MNVQNVCDKIRNHIVGLPTGTVFTSNEVAKLIGGRRIQNKLVASVAREMDCLEYMKLYNGGEWVKK